MFFSHEYNNVLQTSPLYNFSNSSMWKIYSRRHTVTSSSIIVPDASWGIGRSASRFWRPCCPGTIIFIARSRDVFRHFPWYMYRPSCSIENLRYVHTIIFNSYNSQPVVWIRGVLGLLWNLKQILIRKGQRKVQRAPCSANRATKQL